MITAHTRALIIVEGNIGSGKSTASKKLAERLNLRLLEEPVDQDLLHLFYEDMKNGGNEWPFAFQIEMLSQRWAQQMSAGAETLLRGGYDGAILDRSLWGDRVFAEALAIAGKIHPKMFEIYEKFVRNMSVVLWPPTLLLYLTASPETCLERIRRRNRPQEAGITLEYLQSIHEGYQRLLREAKTAFFPWSHAVEVMPVPWDPSIVNDAEWDRTADMVREACRMCRR